MSEPEAFYCRLCATLKPKPDLVSIKKDGGITRKIYEKVLECFHLDIVEDPFPSYVCPDCWFQAGSMYDFYDKVFNAQNIFRKINQENIEMNNVLTSTLKIKIEEATVGSVDLEHANEVRVEEIHSDLGNIEGTHQSNCQTVLRV